MVSEAYVQNILDRSVLIENEVNGQYLIGAMLPNSYIINMVGKDRSECLTLIKLKISELETYLERDKKHYNYDLEEEFINE